MRRLLIFCALFLCARASFGQSSKARTFNGSSDNLQSVSTINLSAASTISISYWAWFNADNAVQVFLETSANATSGSNNGAFVIFLNNDTNTHIDIGAGGVFCGMHFPDASSGVWHHYLWVVPITSCITSSYAVYVDGVQQTLTNDAAVNGTTFGNYTLNVMSRNAASLFTGGRMSDIAIWSSGLTSGNATSLAACGNPQTVNGTPSFYWPINQTSPEVATDGSVNLTVTGTTNSSASCGGGGGGTRGLVIGGGFF